ncbi:MAG TPA: ATP-binding protein [Gemmatimonadaceae bacterium]|nr:ATP-binding protein [Gemmatimonadaceae bacterium]
MTRDLEWELLREREARLRAIIDVAFDGIVISVNGVVVEVTDRVLEHSGYARDDMIGKPVTDFIAEEYREVVRQRQATGVEGRFDAIALAKNGERRHVEVVSRNHVSHGRLVRLGAVRDVTSIRLLEHQVQHAQKMEALGRLASTVAHEFNNVLTVIRGFADVLVGDVEERLRGDAREILRAVDGGAALVRQLQSLAVHGPDHAELIDVSDVVRGSIGILGRLLGKDVSITTDLCGVSAVRANSMQVKQVLLNLAINARDAMPRGGTFGIRTRNVRLGRAGPRGMGDPSELYSLLEISDTGVGMAEDVKARVFEPFFTTKERGTGTGLGLAIVHQIVERSGGFVRVESAQGRGTTFAIYLPLASSA